MTKEFNEKAIGRRRFLKGFLARAVGTGVGAVGGYVVGKGVAGGFGVPLEVVVDQFYGAAHDLASEVSAAAERRLKNAADGVREYIGEYQREQAELSNYWGSLNVLNAENFEELRSILDKVDSYTKESDLTERLTRLKDRLLKRAVDIDQGIEVRYPEKIRGFDEWFSRLIKGKERGSRKSLENYRTRLNSLVKVYDVNRDNRLAQANLLSETEGYFAGAQKEVVKIADSFLNSGKISDSEEQEFFEGIKKVAEKDHSGKELADYLLNTRNYLSSLEASDKLLQFNVLLDDTIKDVSSLQGLLDEGLEIKSKLREAGERDLVKLKDRVDEFYLAMDKKKTELESKGYKINYELYPRLKAARDGILANIGKVRAGIEYGAMGLGGILGLLSGGAISSRKYSRREFMALERRLHELENGKLYKQLDSSNFKGEENDKGLHFN